MVHTSHSQAEGRGFEPLQPLLADMQDVPPFKRRGTSNPRAALPTPPPTMGTWDGVPAGLYAVAIVVLLALGWNAIRAESAHAHTVTSANCTVVASIYPTPDLRQRTNATCQRLRAKHAKAHYCLNPSLTPYGAIWCVWPAAEQPQARRVASCESTAGADEATARARGLGRWADNGDHEGPFQLGIPERRDHGWYVAGDGALRQVRSALSLRRERGFQPWDASRGCWS